MLNQQITDRILDIMAPETIEAISLGIDLKKLEIEFLKKGARPLELELIRDFTTAFRDIIAKKGPGLKNAFKVGQYIAGNPKEDYHPSGWNYV